jgi:hypothetical protein
MSAPLIKILLYLRLSENYSRYLILWIPDQVGHDPTIQKISDNLRDPGKTFVL